MPRLQRRELAAGPRHLVTRRLEFRLEGIPFGSQRLEFGRPTRRGVLQAGPESCQLRLEGFDPPVRSLELSAERREFPTRCLCPLLGHPALLTLGVELGLQGCAGLLELTDPLLAACARLFESGDRLSRLAGVAGFGLQG